MTESVASLLTGAPTSIANVSADELDKVRGALAVWRQKQPRNALRTTYLDGKMPFKDLGISTPPQVVNRVKAILGWPRIACSSLANRSVFDGFVSESGSSDVLGLEPILDANRFDLELPQALFSAYAHSCSFITIAPGDVQSGEPEVLIMPRSAEWSSGVWDKRRRAVSAMLAVTNTDDYGNPSSFDVHLPHVVLMCHRRGDGAWVAARLPNKLNEVLVEPLTYDPQLDRPFGRSRISRAVMSITDNALRTVVRTEISAEFYAAPRMAALGASEEAFRKGKWAAAVDRWFAITRDEDGNIPDVKQFPQMTMQPLVDLYRSYASQFSAETGVAISSLGIVQDNPPSAEAMYAAEKDLIVEARNANRNHSATLRRVAQKVLAVKHKGEVPDEARALQVNWQNPAFTSPVSAADALVKLSAVFPWLADSSVALEFAGFSRPEVTRLLNDKRRAAGGSLLQRALDSAAGSEVAARSPVAGPGAADRA